MSQILRSISTYSVQMREKTDQNNSEYGHFLRSDGPYVAWRETCVANFRHNFFSLFQYCTKFAQLL